MALYFSFFATNSALNSEFFSGTIAVNQYLSVIPSQPVELLGSVVLPSRVPRFCIYGSTDTVVNARAVEAFIAAERAKGELVTGRRLNSGHVSHHLTHTVEYWREVGRFMDS